MLQVSKGSGEKHQKEYRHCSTAVDIPGVPNWWSGLARSVVSAMLRMALLTLLILYQMTSSIQSQESTYFICLLFWLQERCRSTRMVPFSEPHAEPGSRTSWIFLLLHSQLLRWRSTPLRNAVINRIWLDVMYPYVSSVSSNVWTLVYSNPILFDEDVLLTGVRNNPFSPQGVL